MTKYEVTLEIPNRYAPTYDVVLRKRFRSERVARRYAESLAARHSQRTSYDASRYRLVSVTHLPSGSYAEIEPTIVPSIGEIGWTP